MLTDCGGQSGLDTLGSGCMAAAIADEQSPRPTPENFARHNHGHVAGDLAKLHRPTPKAHHQRSTPPSAVAHLSASKITRRNWGLRERARGRRWLRGGIEGVLSEVIRCPRGGWRRCRGLCAGCCDPRREGDDPDSRGPIVRVLSGRRLQREMGLTCGVPKAVTRAY